MRIDNISKLKKTKVESYFLDGFTSKNGVEGIIFELNNSSNLPKDIIANHIVDNIYTARVNYNQWLSLKNNKDVIQLELSN